MRGKEYIAETCTVGKLQGSMRFDRYAYMHMENIPTRKNAYKLAKKGLLLLNGDAVRPDAGISEGDIITLLENTVSKRVFELELKVHYEDDSCAVVEKLPGYPTMANRHRTIENALPFNLRAADSRDALQHPKPAHRLDRSTGGLLLAAKTGSALRCLNRQFHDREIRKEYTAIVSGKLPLKGKIDIPVEGREACTYYVSESYAESLHTGWISLVKIIPHTGRKHQIRRHMAWTGYPVLGDRLYCDGGTFRGKGLFLWSTLLEFRNPESGEPVLVETDPPAKFKKYLARERRRWLRNSE